jgi:ribosomal-protein-alanine N-acetyltransferase
MAVFQRIKGIFLPHVVDEVVIPAPDMAYSIRILTTDDLEEVWKLNHRCFVKGEQYPRFTMSFLLSDPQTLSYCSIDPNGKIVGFVFVSSIQNGTGHVTTIGVAPEHRRRGIAKNLLDHAENSLVRREVNTICLEVRVSNINAQELYKTLNYCVVQRLEKYYNNGEDGFLMVKSLV